MKRKDRRRQEREVEQIRRQQSCFPMDLQKLLAVDSFKAEILKAAEIAEKQGRQRKGRDKELR